MTIDSSGLEQVFLDICKNADSKDVQNDVKISDIGRTENSISSSSVSGSNYFNLYLILFFKFEVLISLSIYL